jgi:ELWxxDGT repeat protein
MNKIVTFFVLLFFISINLLKAEEFPIHCVKRFPPSQTPFESVEFNGKMYFRTGTNLKQCIMVTEGDSLTTKIVYDSLVNIDLIYFQVFEDKLYFSCLRNRKPCFITIDKNEKIDSIMLQGIPTYTTIFNNKLVFSLAFPYFQNGFYVYYPMNIYELNISNPSHVSLIDSVSNPNLGYSSKRLITIGNKLFYSGIRREYNNMLQLFCITGNSKKSIQITNVPNTSCTTNYHNFFEILNNNLVFDGFDSISGIELFITDGTMQNTRLIKDVFRTKYFYCNSSFSVGVYGFTAYKNEIYFFGRDTINGFQLWKTNGDSLGTKLIKKINFTRNSISQNITSVKLMCFSNDKLFFTNDQEDTINGEELYVYDGMNFEHLDLLPGKIGAYPYGFFNHNNHLYFIGNDSAYNSCLWMSDGTKIGTKIQHHNKLSRMNLSNTSFSTLPNFFSYNGSLYFEANYDGLGWGLYRLDDFDAPVKKVDSTLIEQMLCYPNPTKEILNIKFTTLASESCNLSLIDMYGRNIYQENFTSDAATNTKQINISKFAIGTYVVRISYPNKLLKSKIEINK